MSRGIQQLGAMLSDALKRAVVERSLFAGAVAMIQTTGVDDDDVDDSPAYGPQGVAFRTPAGAEVLVAQCGADGANTCVIGTDQRGARPTEKPGGGEVPEGAGGLHVLGSWRVYCDDAGNIYVGDIHGGTFVKMATAPKVDAEIERIWTHLTTAFTAVPNDGGAGLWSAQVTAAGTAAGAVQSTESETVYGK